MIKKIAIGVILIGALAGTAFGQTIKDNLDTMFETRKQAVDVMNARDILDHVYSIAVEKNKEIQALVDSGNFDQIPSNVKTALNQAWTLTKQFIAAIEANQDIMDCFDWESQ